MKLNLIINNIFWYPYYNYIHFDIHILSIIYHILSGIYLLVWLVIIIKMFIVFYFIIILIPAFWLNLCNSFLFQIHFTKNKPFCTDPQLICKCKRFFVTFTMAVNPPEPTLSSVILSYVCFYIVFNEYVNDIIVFDKQKVNARLQCIKVYDEGKMLIFIVKLSLLLTLSWNGLWLTHSQRKVPMWTK